MTAFSQGKAWVQLACSGVCGREIPGFPGMLSVKSSIFRAEGFELLVAYPLETSVANLINRAHFQLI